MSLPASRAGFTPSLRLLLVGMLLSSVGSGLTMSLLVIYLSGSILAGVASSTTWLIACRAVQGVGVGALTALVQVILSDLVSPRASRPSPRAASVSRPGPASLSRPARFAGDRGRYPPF